MSSTRTIAIVGATGAQGGGLARAILGHPPADLRARAITRNSGSEKAAALARDGAEVVEANLDDVESLKRAFDGAYGAFCVTNFWEHFSPEREIAQAANMAAAASSAGLEHVIWSTLEDTRHWIPPDDETIPVLMGKYRVPHFDAKGEADAEFETRGLPTTYLLTSFYWDNLIHFGMAPSLGPDGVAVFTLPMGEQPLPGIAAEDIGKCALGIFLRGESYIGRRVGIAGEHLTGAQMAAALTEALGREVRYQAVEPSVYRGLGFPGAEDLGNMFQVKRDYNDRFCAARSVEESRALNPDLQTFAVWLSRNKDRIVIG